MGSLTYDGWTISFEDRLLAHLHIVIVQQLRNQHSFAMSWVNALEDGDGRGSIWLHPAESLAFRFAGSKVPAISAAWLAQLTASAESSRGLVVCAEDGTLARSQSIRRS